MHNTHCCNSTYVYLLISLYNYLNIVSFNCVERLKITNRNVGFTNLGLLYNMNLSVWKFGISCSIYLSIIFCDSMMLRHITVIPGTSRELGNNCP